MAAPSSPGWYPAPDGNGDQWWNGAGWSESRRNASGQAPGLPGYQAAPPVTPAPVPVSAPNPYAPTAAAAAPVARAKPTNPVFVGLVLGFLGLVVFPPLGIAAIVLGIMGLRKPSPMTGHRGMAIAAIALGAVGLVFGALQLGGIVWAFFASYSG